MGSIHLENTLVSQPSVKQNFTTHLSYDAASNSIAYPSGKSAIIRSLDNNSIIQFTGHGTSLVTVVRFCSKIGSNIMCSGDDSGKVIVWSYSSDADTYGVFETKALSEFQVLSGPITDISWDFEGSRLCVVGDGRDKFGAFITCDTGNSLGEVLGHSARVNACHFKQSRPMRAMTVGYNGKVVFYKGPPFRFASSDTHHGQGMFVRDVKFSPGIGKYAVSVGSDRKIVVYNGTTGEFIKYLEDKTEGCSGLFALAWVDEGDASTRFATVSADGYVRLWDVESGKLLQKWRVGTKTLDQQVGIAITKNHEILSLSLDGSISIFKIDKGEPIKKLVGHNKGVTTLAVNPLVTASYDGAVFKWSKEGLPTMTCGHSNKVISIENYDETTTTVSWDNTLKVSGKVQYNFTEQPRISHTYKGSVAVVTESGNLMLLDSLNGKLVGERNLNQSVTAVTLRNKYLAVGYETSNVIEVFSAGNLNESFVLPTTLRATPSALSLSLSEHYLAAGDTTGKIVLYDLETKTVKTSRWSFHTGKITSMAWRPDEEEEDYVATVSLDTHIFIYSVKKPMKVIKKLNAHKDGINHVEWESPTNIVTAGADACVNNWNVTFP
ncbi:HBL041Wp [Eremothecium sinecaudum]|uniref:HBL041Wp n=1 Tax=Eremothecium sinecaudum TaxID=45286 RepID=A0A125RDX7_9SACH|nr:HBL041Wp [Eremothecium sinecaudum]AMD18861.1 HBL041Wp [Eremothecium sinecaudum]